MLSQQIPDWIDPHRCARYNSCIEGILAIEQLDCLKGLLVNYEGEVTVAAHFGIDEEGWHYIKGSVETELELECQRCLKPMQHKIQSTFAMSPVLNEAKAEKLPEFYEAILLVDDKISLVKLVGDELLLALPIVPLHPSAEKCAPILQGITHILAEERVEAKTVNPFNVLKDLNLNSNNRG